MTLVALKGLLGRKVRTSLTAIAIVLGVAMVSGSFVLTDSVERAFSNIFSTAYDETDAVVSGRKLLDWSQSGRAVVPEEVLTDVRALPRSATPPARSSISRATPTRRRSWTRRARRSRATTRPSVSA